MKLLMVIDTLKRKYKDASLNEVKLVDMSAVELAGYYLTAYPYSPLEALSFDMMNLVVSYLTGKAAGDIIKAVTAKNQVM